MSELSQVPQYLMFPQSTQDKLQAQRLFHGRGHGYRNLKHVTIDWLPPVILITLFESEPKVEVEYLADWVISQFPDCQSIQLQHRYELAGPIELIRGISLQHFSIGENELQFNIQLGKVRNTGLFLDMKNGRQWVQDHCRGQRVLNLFAYTCGFSVAAVAGQAKSVFNVDMSRTGLNVGRENHRLNQQSLETVSFEKLNVFKSMGRLKRKGPFDFLICDPPTLQKGSVDIEKDYPKIIRRLGDFMAVKSTLVLCLNAPELGRQFLINHMLELAPEYKLVDEIKPPAIFVEVEDKGLKILCFKN